MDQRTRPYNVLSLCGGGGGLDLGIELALGNARTVCWVEWEAFAIEYLASRMEAACLAAAPVWTDLRTFDGKPWRGVVDILAAGYPCQPFSLAGKRLGSDDPRHLWPHVARVIGEAQPPVVFLENVGGHLSLGFEQVAGELQGLGYRVAAGLFTAEEVGASHKRERLFILGVVNDPGLGWREGWTESEVRGGGDSAAVPSGQLADTASPRCSWWQDPRTSSVNEGKDRGGGSESERGCPRVDRTFPPGPDQLDEWASVLSADDSLAPAQSKVRLLADGLAADRGRYLKLLGNGVVPLQAAYAFCSLWSSLFH